MVEKNAVLAIALIMFMVGMLDGAALYAPHVRPLGKGFFAALNFAAIGCVVAILSEKLFVRATGVGVCLTSAIFLARTFYPI